MIRILLLLRPENEGERNQFYIHAITRYGGELVTVLESDNEEKILDVLKEVDGILLPGGDVVGPWDFFLIDYAVSHQLRLLGICQGMQSMALWKTGRELVDIGDINHDLEHYGFHHIVTLRKGSQLQQIIKEDSILVNSFHHSTVLDGGNFAVVGCSDDGLVEALESKNHPFQIGVQWHPERMLEDDIYSQYLFQAFLTK